MQNHAAGQRPRHTGKRLLSQDDDQEAMFRLSSTSKDSSRNVRPRKYRTEEAEAEYRTFPYELPEVVINEHDPQPGLGYLPIDSIAEVERKQAHRKSCPENYFNASRRRSTSPMANRAQMADIERRSTRYLNVIENRRPPYSQPSITRARSHEGHESPPDRYRGRTSHSTSADREIINPSFHGGGAFAGASHFTIEAATMIDNSVSITERVGGLTRLQQFMASSALYDSKERFDPPKCDENTRIRLIGKMTGWARDSDISQRMLCLTGPAGSGKSALQQTVVEKCAEEGSLLAAFFFYAQDARRNNLGTLIPTLAYQIYQNIAATRKPMIKAVEDDPAIFERKVDIQLNRIIIVPLQDALQSPGTFPRSWPRNIFIDGVDECRGEVNQIHLLQLLRNLALTLNHSEFALKICFASRPEHAVRSAISARGHLGRSGLLYHIDLSEHNATSDIRIFLQRRLTEIAETTPYPLPSAPWPSEDDIEKLADNSSGQFVYAATIIKYLSERRRSPFSQLQVVLSWSPGTKRRERPFAALDTLYTSIFAAASEAYKESKSIDDDLVLVRYIRMLQVMALTYTEAQPGAVEALLGLEQGELQILVSDLHSLVDPEGSGLGLQFFKLRFHHKSVPDFLQDPDRCGNLFISSTRIALDLLSLSTRWLVDEARIEDCLSKEFALGIWLICALEAITKGSDTEREELRTFLAGSGNDWAIVEKGFSLHSWPSRGEHFQAFLHRCNVLNLFNKSKHPEWSKPLRMVRSLDPVISNKLLTAEGRWKKP
ncbi:hypothetical protein FA15DRAFT_671499 [Coprinopsis marcescibilis]|uniref:Nephrocystin 3-like N-terminal domain-containing protein n=1 Tax=Coprinopsis marcescibilis TaxID=230819 RepID=A0A5C3KPL9_COPMA|nr:hypothetical protein FA15DRAFT_671499 [Coprinopsis marcescibilis]